MSRRRSGNTPGMSRDFLPWKEATPPSLVPWAAPRVSGGSAGAPVSDFPCHLAEVASCICGRLPSPPLAAARPSAALAAPRGRLPLGCGSAASLSTSPSSCLCACLTFYLSIRLSIYSLSLYLFICPSFHLFIYYLPFPAFFSLTYLSTNLFICTFIYRSVFFSSSPVYLKRISFSLRGKSETRRTISQRRKKDEGENN